MLNPINLMTDVVNQGQANLRYSNACHEALMALNEIRWKGLDPADQKNIQRAKAALYGAIDPSGQVEIIMQAVA
jgi:hypothetical protein